MRWSAGTLTGLLAAVAAVTMAAGQATGPAGQPVAAGVTTASWTTTAAATTPQPAAGNHSAAGADAATGAARLPLHNNRVYVMGDSVLLGTVDTLPPAMRGWRVTMNCEGSRRLTEAIPILRQVRKHLGSVVVIQMGNNYIRGEDGDFASQMHTAMHILRKVPLVVWVTVATVHADQRHIDRTIRRAPRRYRNVVVADWAPLAAAHPGYTYDGLHLTPSGRTRMSKLIARTVGKPPRKRAA